MEHVFSLYLQASLWGSVLILAVALLRWCMGKTPRWILCLFWLLAALRLLLPFQLESPVSLQPDTTVVAEVLRVQPEEPVSQPQPDMQAPQPQPEVENFIEPAPPQGIRNIDLLIYLWLGIAAAIMLYALYAYFVLRFRLRKATLREPGVREGSMVPGAFVLGFFRPTIFLPSNMNDRERDFVLAHERAHISRGDQWWKMLGYLCCSVHWFNPLVWVGYVLACRDIEYACDEKIVKHMDLEQRKAYSLSLLYSSTDTKRLTFNPVAFTGGGLKSRVRRVLALKKATPLQCGVSILVVVLTAACFLTCPVIAAEVSELPHIQTENPEVTAPAETQPAETDPTWGSEPVETQPVETVPSEPQKPTEPKPTEPKPTEPKPTESKPTEPEKPVKPAKPTVSGLVPEVVQNGQTAPGTDTLTHTHTYSVTVQAPTCLVIGYTENTCACGYVYYNGFRSAFGHRWALVERVQATALKDGCDTYRCEGCGQENQEITAQAGYKSFDLSGVDKEVTAYAAKQGFQTAEGRLGQEAEVYSLYWGIEELYSYGGRDVLAETGKSFVYRWKSDCQDAGKTPSDCVISVELEMDQGVTLRVYCLF